jgi:uncharacterized integral membrane protein (TIGR00698 family)
MILNLVNLYNKSRYKIIRREWGNEMNELKLKDARPQKKKSRFSDLWKVEDWWTVWLGFIAIIGIMLGVVTKPVLPAKWGDKVGKSIATSIPLESIPGILVTGIVSLVIFSIAVYFIKKEQLKKFFVGFVFLFILAVVATLIGNYGPWRYYGFNEVVWALLVGLIISNTVKIPDFLKGAIRTELYIKTGLVLLGASILFNRMLALGVMGLGLSWIATPLVIVLTYWFSQRVLKMHDQKSFAITLATALSVCGVSAAIATGAASKAKKEDISFTISISLIFTVIMMVGIPAIIKMVGMDPIVGGAWIGGTVDSTGAVVASGAMLGEKAMEVASLVKMIQNILIGVVAFVIALIWAVADTKQSSPGVKVGAKEIWLRMPKFIIGFITTSLLFSFIVPKSSIDASLPVINGFRELFFTFAFVSIGLESNLGDIRRTVKGGKPLTLFIVGQLLNIIVALGAAYIFFSGKFFTLPV